MTYEIRRRYCYELSIVRSSVAVVLAVVIDLRRDRV